MSSKYNLRTFTFKGDGINTCKCCEAKIKKGNMYEEACDAICAKELAELKAIPLSANFVVSLVNRTKNESERISQLKQFINRHKLDEEKVLMRFNEMKDLFLKNGINSLKKRPNIAC